MRNFYNKNIDLILLVSLIIAIGSYMLTLIPEIKIISTILLILSGSNIFLTLFLYDK